MSKKYDEILEALHKDEKLRKELIVVLSRDYPREFLSRVKLDPGRLNQALGGVVVSCKEWQE